MRVRGLCLRSRTRRISSIFGFAWSRGKKKRDRKKKEVAAIAVEQRTLVRHRLTFHRNPLASSAGGRVSRSRLRRLMGSVAIRQRRVSATARQRRILESREQPRAAGAFTLLGGCSAPARSLNVASAPTRGSARPPYRRSETRNSRSARAQRILPRVAHRRRNVAVVEYAAARNANGNYSGANRIFDASRDWSARSAARLPIISSSALAFSHGPSFSISASFFSFSLLQAPTIPFLFVGLFHAPRRIFPSSPRSNFVRDYAFANLYAKPKRALARAAASCILMAMGGARWQNRGYYHNMRYTCH